jgi:hypothetical protein
MNIVQKKEISVYIFGLINNQICYDAYGWA